MDKKQDKLKDHLKNLNKMSMKKQVPKSNLEC